MLGSQKVGVDVMMGLHVLFRSLAPKGRQHPAGGIAHRRAIEPNFLPVHSSGGDAAGRMDGEILARLRFPWGKPHGKELSALRAYRKTLIDRLKRKESCAVEGCKLHDGEAS